MLTFQLDFVYETYLMNLMLLNLETHLKKNVHDFSIDCNAIDKSDISKADKYLMVLNLHKYPMVKNNIK